MTRKQWYLVVDTETTNDGMAFDFAAVVCDRAGNIAKSCAIIVRENMDKPLFSLRDNAAWSESTAERKREGLLRSVGITRRIASSQAINAWLAQAWATFRPMLTAYNLSFDAKVCTKTGINLSGFPDRFCLWEACATMVAPTKAYRQFALQHHRFSITARGSCTVRTDAETMGSFCRGSASIIPEPHTAFEDIIGHEIPCLVTVLKRRGWRNLVQPYDWKILQARDLFKVA